MLLFKFAVADDQRRTAQQTLLGCRLPLHHDTGGSNGIGIFLALEQFIGGMRLHHNRARIFRILFGEAQFAIDFQLLPIVFLSVTFRGRQARA